MSRVRSEDPAIAAAIVRGTEHSPTFGRLVEDISATDGLVYVLEGQCGQGIRACLHMSIEMAGPNRLLRVLVSPRRPPGYELIVSIGHELQHALEALRNPRIWDRLTLVLLLPSGRAEKRRSQVRNSRGHRGGSGRGYGDLRSRPRAFQTGCLLP